MTVLPSEVLNQMVKSWVPVSKSSLVEVGPVAQKLFQGQAFFFGSSGITVIQVLLARYPFQICERVVLAVSVLVVDLQAGIGIC